MSRVCQSACINSSRLIVGTPEKFVTRSRSINSSARVGSHLYVNTIEPPTNVQGCRMQLLAVTWNSGVGAMNTGGVGTTAGSTVGGAGRSPAATAFASASRFTCVMKAMFMMLWTDPRWVSCAPFGNPVVPEV